MPWSRRNRPTIAGRADCRSLAAATRNGSTAVGVPPQPGDARSDATTGTTTKERDITNVLRTIPGTGSTITTPGPRGVTPPQPPGADPPPSPPGRRPG